MGLLRVKNVIQTSFVNQSIYSAAHPAVFANKVCSTICIHLHFFNYEDEYHFNISMEKLLILLNKISILNIINFIKMRSKILSNQLLIAAQNLCNN